MKTKTLQRFNQSVNLATTNCFLIKRVKRISFNHFFLTNLLLLFFFPSYAQNSCAFDNSMIRSKQILFVEAMRL